MDRFASFQTRQLERFYSRYHNPRCEAVDAFTISWFKGNWIFPPPHLIPHVLKHMSSKVKLAPYFSLSGPQLCGGHSLSTQMDLGKLYGLNDISTLSRDFPSRICGEQCIQIRHFIISNSSHPCLLSLVAQIRIICGSDHLVVVIVGTLDYQVSLHVAV